MAADLAEIHPGSTVAVFSCGPVGQFAIASAKLLNAGRIFAIDAIPSRLAMAQDQGAEIINFEREDVIEAINGFTGGIGVDRALDCVGVDANRPHPPAVAKTINSALAIARPDADNWHPGDAPSQVLEWAVEVLAKAGTFSVVGVYGDASSLAIGNAVEKNLTLKMGNCHHRKYIPRLLDLVRSGTVDPSDVLTQVEPMEDVIEAYKLFDKRTPGWVKVMLQPQSTVKAA